MENLSRRINLKVILAILNSEYGRLLLTNIRSGAFNVYPEFLRKIPIPIIYSEKQHEIVVIVDKILSEKKSNPNADTTSMEKEIDMLVYALYGLTQEEINSIENKK